MKRIALLIETSTTWGIHLVRGAVRYSHQHGPWSLFLEPRGRSEILRVPKGWHGDGIIARVTTPELARDIKRSGVPAVNVSWYDYGAPQIARCTVSERQVGVLAGEYLAERGFRRFAYYPPFDRRGYVNRIGAVFAKTVEAHGGECDTYRGKAYDLATASWEEQLTDLADWLMELRKPVAVLAFGDFRGRLVTEACTYLGLRVPDDVAVMGTEQDELFSALSTPHLSSIDVGGMRVGYEAAELLNRLMNGEPPPAEPIELAPVGVITRQSTELLAIDDPELAIAFRFIRDHAHEPISVDDVLNNVALSRRALEQRFAAAVGRSPASAIRHVRLERAKQLLFDTDHSVAQIARACGFRYPERMARAFKSEFKLTPTQFRSRNVLAFP